MLNCGLNVSKYLQAITHLEYYLLYRNRFGLNLPTMSYFRFPLGIIKNLPDRQPKEHV